MQTIKEIEKRMQYIQLKIDGENRDAERERNKSAAFLQGGDNDNAALHATAATKHEQDSQMLQQEMSDLTNQTQQLQTQIAELGKQKETITAEKDSELQRIDSEVARIQGSF